MAGYANLNLGNMAAALRATGSDPSWLEEMQRREQQGGLPPQQAPSVPPETMREREASIPQNPYPTPINERDFNPNASTGQLTRERVGAQNEALDLKGRQGEIASQGFDAQGAAAQELEQGRREGLAATRQRVDANRQQRAELERQAGERLSRISALVDQGPPQPSVMSKVMTIMGSVLAAGGDQGQAAVGRGVAMLGQSMAGDVNEWKTQIAANQAVHSQLLAAAQNEGQDSTNEIGVEDGLQQLAAGVYNSALERIKAETNSAETKRAASEMQNGLRAQMVDGELNRRAKAQQGRGDEMLWRMPMDELAAQIAAGNGGKHAQQVYQQRAKASQEVRKGEAGIDATLADTEKKRRELEQGGPDAEVLPGYVATIDLGPADKTEIRKNARAVSSIVEDLGKLRAIRERNKGGTFNANDEQDAQRIMGGMSTKLSQMNGAGAPSEGERELFMKSLTDPTGFYVRKDPTTLYDRMARDFHSNFEAGLKAVGVERADARASGRGLGFQPDPAKRTGGPAVANRGRSGGW